MGGRASDDFCIRRHLRRSGSGVALLLVQHLDLGQDLSGVDQWRVPHCFPGEWVVERIVIGADNRIYGLVKSKMPLYGRHIGSLMYLPKQNVVSQQR